MISYLRARKITLQQQKDVLTDQRKSLHRDIKLYLLIHQIVKLYRLILSFMSL